jgi:glutamate racemase
MKPASSPAPCIGVFDSGVGGLSVLRALRARLPHTRLHYLADSAHAPYGEREPQHVLNRSEALTRHLWAHGAQLVVVACNTATALAVQHIRTLWPELPVVGVEPGIKPAVALSPRGRIGVMATTGTLSSERFQALWQRHRGEAHWHLLPCPGLATRIEHGSLSDPELLALIARFAANLRASEVDTVVLGCTHYPFVIEPLRAALPPDVRFVDTAQAVAERAAALWQAADHGAQTPSMVLQTTGESEAMARVARPWLSFEGAIEKVDV